MKPIQAELIAQYNALLTKRAIPPGYHVNFRKWLRYYLDFCHKYSYQQTDTDSLSPFLKKLQQKRQSVHQQKQAIKSQTIKEAKSPLDFF